MSKAYDRLEWKYILEILRRMGFSDHWIELIRCCITTVDFHIRVNNNVVGPIVPERGIRQGDPLSPYLFSIASEGLSATIEKQVVAGNLYGLKFSKKAPAEPWVPNIWETQSIISNGVR